MTRCIGKRFIPLVSIVVLTVLGAAATLIWRAIAIERYPSCLTYQSEGNVQLGDVLSTSIGSYLIAHGFVATSEGGAAIKWESDSTLAIWGSGSKLYLNVCTKNEASSDWLTIAQGIQELGMRASWSPEAFLSLNPDVTMCKAGNEMSLGYPVDFKKMGLSIETLKITCRGKM